MSPIEKLKQIKNAINNCDHLINDENTRQDLHNSWHFYLELKNELLKEYKKQVTML